MKQTKTFLGIVAIVLLSAGVAGVTTYKLMEKNQSTATFTDLFEQNDNMRLASYNGTDAQPVDLTAAAEASIHAVVHIRSTQLSRTQTVQDMPDIFDFFFGDGRGQIKAYGDWFIRLKLTGSLAGNRSIGIHGSTNNEASVPGRDSEGCIRLRDADIITLHDLYAQVGQKVLIKGVGERKLPFEEKAEAALGNKYVAPTAGRGSI